MKKPAFFSKLEKEFKSSKSFRGEIIGRSNTALSFSKRAIFALHRNDLTGAKKMLDEAKVLFGKCEKHFVRHPELGYEGAYKAALEEYAEAQIFEGFLKTGKFGLIDKAAMKGDIYIGGLSDATGEVVRYAVRRATERDEDSVKKAHEAVEIAVEVMLNLDLTGYLRQKFDQAKKNLRALEQMLYDLSLRK
ncbi:MAG: hypothetical protein ABIH21_00710 [Patescibacteria group bacterium]